MRQWFRASFAATLMCIVWYTLFGFVFVRHHAAMISSGMEMLLFYDMVPLVMPDDAYLVSFIHQLGSSLFFGCTLGVLNAIIAMAASLSPWILRRFSRHDIPVFILLGCIFTFLSFSREMPCISILFGFVCPFVFFIPWAFVCSRGGNEETMYGRWLIMVMIAASPFLGLLALSGSSFETIRDSMLEIPTARSLSNFYYNHTYLAAHIIKPPSAYEQKIIAVSGDIKRMGPRPHGTLWIRADDPCAVKGRTVAVSRSPLKCESILLGDSEPANISNRVMKDLNSVYDYNEKMRSGIGLFFYKGPLILIPVLFIMWLALSLSKLYGDHPKLAGIMILMYLGCFYYPFHSVIIQHKLQENPQRIHEYLLSEHEVKRYIALKAFPEQVTDKELVNFSHDSSARIRLTALFEAGNRKNPEFTGIFKDALEDDQLNVRTRACLALGNLGNIDAVSLLEKVLENDPSWYVRGYAYRAIGRIRPVAKSVSFSEGQGVPLRQE